MVLDPTGNPKLTSSQDFLTSGTSSLSITQVAPRKETGARESGVRGIFPLHSESLSCVGSPSFGCSPAVGPGWDCPKSSSALEFLFSWTGIPQLLQIQGTEAAFSWLESTGVTGTKGMLVKEHCLRI